MRTRVIDVDGQRLAIHSTGDASPPVVFVSGLGDPGAVWAPAIRALQVDHQLVTYDRPGLGTSPAHPTADRSPTTFDAAATQLRAVLSAADVRSPRIFVGHSVGALIIDAYARAWPTEVAGAVLVDASDPHLYLELDTPQPIMADGDAPDAVQFDWQATRTQSFKQDFDHPCAVISSAIGRWKRARNPEKYKPFDLDQLDYRWQRHQRDLAVHHATGLLIADTAGHRIHEEAPRLVAHGIEAVIAAISDGTRDLEFDPAALAAAGGRWDEVALFDGMKSESAVIYGPTIPGVLRGAARWIEQHQDNRINHINDLTWNHSPAAERRDRYSVTIYYAPDPLWPSANQSNP